MTSACRRFRPARDASPRPAQGVSPWLASRCAGPFGFGETWEGFYAIGHLDGFELHLKESPKNDEVRRHCRDNEHLDAAAGVDGVGAFYEQCVANGVTIMRGLAPTEWGTKDFYVEDPDGNIISFGGR